MNRLGDILDVPVVQASEADPPILGQENRVFGSQFIAHVARHTREGEHSDLLRYVAPVVTAPHLLQHLHQLLPHGAYAARHLATVVVVLLRESLVCQNRPHDARPVDGRAAVHRPDDQLELAQHRRPLLRGVAHDAERPRPLAVQAKVLGEGLRQHNPVSLRHEEAEGGSVGLGVAGREALVGRVEEDLVTLGFDHFGDVLPLVHCRITASRVVGTCVEEDDTSAWSTLQVLHQSVVIKAVGTRVVVTVPPHFHSRLAKDGNMIPPSRGRNVDRDLVKAVGLGHELRQEVTPYATRPCPTQALHPGDGREVGVGPVRKLERQPHVRGISRDGGVLLVRARVREQPFLGLAHAGQYPWLPGGVAVGSHAHVDLVLVRAGLERLGDAEDGVGGSLGDGGEVVRALDRLDGGGSFHGKGRRVGVGAGVRCYRGED
mmetsp:Transcript_2527/g.5384  ORF Transcript_2527/g.5384 Transcript_2527/m.5384 type:complete len:432 (-) Transcript_2527:144-1439(-)